MMFAALYLMFMLGAFASYLFTRRRVDHLRRELEVVETMLAINEAETTFYRDCTEAYASYVGREAVE